MITSAKLQHGDFFIIIPQRYGIHLVVQIVLAIQFTRPNDIYFKDKVQTTYTPPNAPDPPQLKAKAILLHDQWIRHPSRPCCKTQASVKSCAQHTDVLASKPNLAQEHAWTNHVTSSKSYGMCQLYRTDKVRQREYQCEGLYLLDQ